MGNRNGIYDTPDTLIFYGYSLYTIHDVLMDIIHWISKKKSEDYYEACTDHNFAVMDTLLRVESETNVVLSNDKTHNYSYHKFELKDFMLSIQNLVDDKLLSHTLNKDKWETIHNPMHCYSYHDSYS